MEEELSKLSDGLFDLELSSSNKGWSDFLAAMPDRYNHDLQAAELARTESNYLIKLQIKRTTCITPYIRCFT